MWCGGLDVLGGDAKLRLQVSQHIPRGRGCEPQETCPRAVAGEGAMQEQIGHPKIMAPLREAMDLVDHRIAEAQGTGDLEQLLAEGGILEALR